MEVERNRDEYVRAFRQVATAGLAPRFVDAIDGRNEWYAVVCFVPGRQPTPSDSDWGALWRQIPSLLETLTQVTDVPQFDVLDHWVMVLGQFDFPESSAQELKQLLLAEFPSMES
jgi:hypothetical protein